MLSVAYCDVHAQIAAFPCEVVHGDWVGSASCEVNVIKRWARAFVQSFALYTPVCLIGLIEAPS